jgi:hypothetical protein
MALAHTLGSVLAGSEKKSCLLWKEHTRGAPAMVKKLTNPPNHAEMRFSALLATNIGGKLVFQTNEGVFI